TCKALSSRSAWQGTCRRSATIPPHNNEAIRRFLENEFRLYQIINRDSSPAGVITGYYEPLLNGNLQQGGRYTHPIYGTPEDLLYLDSRALAGHKEPVSFTVQGRTLVRASSNSGSPGSVTKRYIVDVGDTKPDIRDKRLRVRVDGDHIVPYYTRAEIERGALKAPVIAWVDSDWDLYIMQIQGSGKIRLPSGELLRVGYAEQ